MLAEFILHSDRISCLCENSKGVWLILREIQDCRVTREGKEKEGPLEHLDIRGLLDLRGPRDTPEVLATQVGVGFTTQKARNGTLSIALTSENQLPNLKAI